MDREELIESTMLDTTGKPFAVLPDRRSLAPRYRHLASTRWPDRIEET
jgi:hypothetical protein